MSALLAALLAVNAGLPSAWPFTHVYNFVGDKVIVTDIAVPRIGQLRPTLCVNHEVAPAVMCFYSPPGEEPYWVPVRLRLVAT